MWSLAHAAANQTEVDVLKKRSLQFIVENEKNVFKNKDWKESLQKRPVLMTEVLEAITCKDSEKLVPLQEN